MSDSDDGPQPGLQNGNYSDSSRNGLNDLTHQMSNTNIEPGPNYRQEEDADSTDSYQINPLQRRASLIQDGQKIAPVYRLVHRVICDNRRADGEDHEEHSPSADYLDEPRLFKGDTRGTALRGMQPLLNPQEYWDDHPEVCAIVTKEYNCSSYHRRVRDRFHLIAPGIDRHVFNKFRAWFYRLDVDGPSAVSVGESIIISQPLVSSLIELIHDNQLGEWDQERNLKAPYDYFYHFRRHLRQHSEKQLEPAYHEELEVLLDYIDETQGDNFNRVDAMFESGMVHREIFGKLFRPNDLIVTSQEGHPRGFVAERVYVNDRQSASERQSVTLECWTWDFDGSFRKKATQIQVSWPGNVPRIPVTSLSAWPLRLDKSDMRERLDKRGKMFWACRYKKLVSYNAPTPTIFELQVTNPKYMIDFPTYRQMHTKKFPQPMATDAEMEEQGIQMSRDDPPLDPFCLLLPSTMPGYAFHDKKWSKSFVYVLGDQS